MSDIRAAYRALKGTPGFTLTAILTLALGVGMNTAMFSMVNAVMLRGLPYRQPDRLISLWEEAVGRGPAAIASSGGTLGTRQPQRFTVSAANLADYEKQTRAFEGLSVIGSAAMNLTGSGTPERLAGQQVNSNFLSLLGVSPVLGRDFVPEDDRPGSNSVVILSNELWRRLGADSEILGRALNLNRNSYRVIGVLPPGFQSPSEFSTPAHIQFYVPAALTAMQLTDHADHDFDVIGRLAPGVSNRRAQEELDAVSTSLAQTYPDDNRGIRAVVGPLQEDLVRNASEPMWILLGATGLVALIACINVANLMLVRAVSRRHEVNIRFALGSTPLREAAFFTEGLLVSAMGCGAGLLLGSFLMDLLIRMAPASIPRLDGIRLDQRVFFVSAALALITGLIAGLLPVWQERSLARRSRHSGTSRPATSRSRAVLVAAEVSLSTILLIGAGLLITSLVKVLRVDLGFQPDRVIAMNINLPDAPYASPEQRLRFFEALESHVQALPGVQSVAFANRMPMRGGWGGGIQIEGEESERDVDLQAVSPGYFETLGMSLVRGRLFASGDPGGQPYVAVVNQAFVRQFFRDRDPLGRRIRRNPESPWIEVAGVVNDIRRGGKTERVNPQVYLSAAQVELYPVRIADFAVRTAGDPKLLVRAIQGQVLSLDKDQPVTNVRTLDEIISGSVAQRRFQTILLIVFAGVALALALTGIFGVLSHSVSQRTRELGIRVALGARRGQVLAIVLKQAAVWVTSGLAAGMVGALALSRYLQSLLFGIQAHDWRAYLLSAVLLGLVALAAAAIPARRAASVDPVRALRHE